MTPIATKNGSIIVKDGKLAEGCECCGGWWCEGAWCCDLSDVGGACVQGGDCCVNPNRKLMSGSPSCRTTPITVSVSGIATPPSDCPPGSTWRSVTDFNQGLSLGPLVNAQYAADEMCGSISVTRQIPESAIAQSQFWRFIGGSVYIAAGLSNKRRAVNNALLSSCNSGYAARYTLVSLSFGFYENVTGGNVVYLQYAGVTHGGCVSIADLPQLGSWLAGQSASLSVAVTLQNAVGPSCPLPNQGITVSFS